MSTRPPWYSRERILWEILGVLFGLVLVGAFVAMFIFSAWAPPRY